MHLSLEDPSPMANSHSSRMHSKQKPNLTASFYQSPNTASALAARKSSASSLPFFSPKAKNTFNLNMNNTTQNNNNNHSTTATTATNNHNNSLVYTPANSILTDELRRRFAIFITSASAFDTTLSTFLAETLQRFEALSAECLRCVKQNAVLAQQLQITKDVLSQRDSLMQQMREDLLEQQRAVKRMEIEQESAKNRYERFTKQNNDNFYKIAQRIKESVSIKAQKQQDQIEHLKLIISNNGNNTSPPISFSAQPYNQFPPRLSSERLSFAQQGIPPNSNIITTNGNTSLNEVPSREISPLKQFNASEGLTSQQSSQFFMQQQQQQQQHHLLQVNPQMTTITDLPSDQKLENVRRFFAETDLSSVGAGKNGSSSYRGTGRVDSFKKLQQQKKKLHSMFIFKSPIFSTTTTPKAAHAMKSSYATAAAAGTSSSANPSMKDLYQQPSNLPVATATVAASPRSGGLKLARQSTLASLNNYNSSGGGATTTAAQGNPEIANLKTAQKQFNQALNINFHHMRASSLAEEFFLFKQEGALEDTERQSVRTSNNAPQMVLIQQQQQQSSFNQTSSTPRVRSDFLQHSSDYHFYSLLLDMNKSDKHIIKAHKENNTLSFLRKIAETESTFRKFMLDLTPEKYQSCFDSVQSTMQFEQASFRMILKLKRIIISVQKMHSSLLLMDAFTTIIDETCSILACERASVFLVDPRRDELWTKVAKDSKPIRVPIGKGFVGTVAKTGETLNILDAHQDSRFNREIDLKNNYRTKSVLCIPIRDSSLGHIIGVLQAINKKEGDFFTTEDEGLIQILAQLATAVLRNSLYHDEREVFHNSVQILLEAGLNFQLQSSEKEIMLHAQMVLMEKFDCPNAAVWIFDRSTSQLIRYFKEDSSSDEINLTNNAIADANPPNNNNNNSQGKSPFYSSESNSPITNASNIRSQTCSHDQGILGHTFENGACENVMNAYEHPLFNGSIDINTSLPLITVLIKKVDKHDRFKFQKIGVLQCVNPKGLQSLVFNSKSVSHNISSTNAITSSSNTGTNSSNNNKSKSTSDSFSETLDHFSLILGDALFNRMPKIEIHS